MAASSARPLAVVTGVSSGIGFELARQFGENGFDLIIAAEDEELASAASELERAGAGVEAVRVDLATEAGVAELYPRIQALARPVEAIALNAGSARAVRSRPIRGSRMSCGSWTSTCARRSSWPSA